MPPDEMAILEFLEKTTQGLAQSARGTNLEVLCALQRMEIPDVRSGTSSGAFFTAKVLAVSASRRHWLRVQVVNSSKSISGDWYAHM